MKSYNKNFIFYILLGTLIMFANKSSAVQAVDAVSALAKRVVPSISDKIVFILKNKNSDKDYFELESKNGEIIITGNNANSMAVGLNYYLKYYCFVYISWNESDKIKLPLTIPAMPEKIIKIARCQNRFFLNYCTFGYTMPWWQWKDWQKFIDWMALNGVNMPLSITGEEAVWYKVWKKFGLKDSAIRSYFTGPAFLPWHRMANIDHWDGPLPQSWINNQANLQKQIVTRERELGMKPVLPAFAGHVPEAIKNKFPKSNITSLGDWGGFSAANHSYFLDPLDPLFYKIQKEYLAEQTRMFGTDHIYGADPFNEVTPPSWKPEYLASVSKTIYTSLKKNDSLAQWLQMSWIFYFNHDNWTNERIQAFVNAIPQNKMILLDYYCDSQEVWKTTNKFFGQPYIWCYLGNFGSNNMLAGNIKEVETRMENAFINGGENLWGIGSTLEGFGVNEVMYEYILDKAWSSGPTNIDDWITNWARCRIGKNDSVANTAWNILKDKIYTEPGKLGQGTLTNARPSFGENDGWPANPETNYNNRDLIKVWSLLNDAGNDSSTDAFKYDVVNIGRQVLGNYFLQLRNQFKIDYEKQDLNKLKAKGNEMLAVINDMDTLLASNENFLLGKWLNDAKTLGTNDAEKKYYEKDARKILTTWGPQGGELTDYANRNYAGLMKDYYGKRWQMFINDVINSAKNNKPFNQKIFDKKASVFEWNWTKEHKEFSSISNGNSLEISKLLYRKYYKPISENN